MVRLMKILWTVLVLMLIVILQQEASSSTVTANYSRLDFPDHFIFGASTSANQVEGAAFEDGRTPSILDMVHIHIEHENKWVISCDEYHKYKEDVKLMVDTRLDAYKFSISWSRLIPNGRGPVNPKGIEYYNNLINELISQGIQPHVMLMHWDLPHALWEDYGGRISRKIVNDFTAYADVCFREFGDRVLHWTTFNEANEFPLQMCDDDSKWSPCTSSNASYIGAHNLLLAHASAVRLYRTKYQEKQHGLIGLNLYTPQFVPETDAEEDLFATQRAKDFWIGWFMNPLMFGEYPEIMKKIVGNRLPSFTKHESELVKSSFDFIAITCYATMCVKDNKPNSQELDHPCHSTDMAATPKYCDVFGDVVQPILECFKQDYGNPVIYIHENGYRTARNSSLNDQLRIKYLNTSVGSILSAIRNGSRIQGYFVWSLIDVLELALTGFDQWGFGLYYVDLDDPDLRRHPKASAKWYASFLKGRSSKTEILQPLTNLVHVS